MATGRRTLYPQAAVDWLVGEGRHACSTSAPVTAPSPDAAGRGHEVFCIDRDVEAVAALPERLGTRLHVAGQVESLPYLSCHFDAVTASANLHRFAPGLALSEIARVLKPGGELAVAYNMRDDTVPWVRRLAAILQQVDPSAMAGAFGAESVQAVVDSPYFGPVEKRAFRNWVPIDRARAAGHGRAPARDSCAGPRRPGTAAAEVGAVYDTSARPPEPLLLPYQAACWRAHVDHSALAIRTTTPTSSRSRCEPPPLAPAARTG